MRYREAEWLREKYHDEELSIGDIADLCDTSTATIHKWKEEHGIETRNRKHRSKDGSHKDEDWLREEYIEKRNSSADIASEVGVSKDTILYWLREFDIPIRDSSEATEAEWEGADERREEVAEVLDNSVQRCSYFMDDEGYMIASDSYRQVRLHRLIAVAEYGYDEVVENDSVHHRIPVPWLNFPLNLQPVTKEEHQSIHS